MTSDDTIVAISSAVGSAARMIVRMSGRQAFDLARLVCPDFISSPTTAQHSRLRLRALATPLPLTLYTFIAPRSYTGEDLIEFHLPGNPLLAKMLLADLTAGGARSAEPGEFTARAYFNGRIDLTEAEGVAATISAHNDQELRAARQLLAGELAHRLRPTMDFIAQTLALVEVGIDFTEEDVTFLQPAEIHARVTQANDALARLIGESARFERLSHEPRVVLVGRPNAGKSTLLNALAGLDRAVVSPVAGTTRDVLSAEVALARGLIRVVDVAGLEGLEESAADESAAINDVQRSMRDYALRELEGADHVVLVQDGGSELPALSLSREPDLIVLSKMDLQEGTQQTQDRLPSPSSVGVSAHTGANLDVLRNQLDAMAFGSTSTGSTLALNGRHVQAIGEARLALKRVVDGTAAAQAMPAELLAVDLRNALDALGQILGNISPDDVLGRIFSAFCIGK